MGYGLDSWKHGPASRGLKQIVSRRPCSSSKTEWFPQCSGGRQQRERSRGAPSLSPPTVPPSQACLLLPHTSSPLPQGLAQTPPQTPWIKRQFIRLCPPTRHPRPGSAPQTQLCPPDPALPCFPPHQQSPQCDSAPVGLHTDSPPAPGQPPGMEAPQVRLTLGSTLAQQRGGSEQQHMCQAIQSGLGCPQGPSPGGQLASGGQARDSHMQQSGGFPGSQWTTQAGVGQGQALASTWPLHLGSIPPRLLRAGTDGAGNEVWGI